MMYVSVVACPYVALLCFTVTADCLFAATPLQYSAVLPPSPTRQKLVRTVLCGCLSGGLQIFQTRYTTVPDPDSQGPPPVSFPESPAHDLAWSRVCRLGRYGLQQEDQQGFSQTRPGPAGTSATAGTVHDIHTAERSVLSPQVLSYNGFSLSAQIVAGPTKVGSRLELSFAQQC